MSRRRRGSKGNPLFAGNYSEDFLQENPDLAEQMKKSRAKTPGGEGHHGHTPDAQRYEHTTDYLWLYWQNARNMPGLLEYNMDPLLALHPELAPTLIESIATLRRLNAKITEAMERRKE